LSREPRRTGEPDGASAEDGSTTADPGTPPAAAPEAGGAVDVKGNEDRPATYREVFRVREYRAVFGASTLSWIGDYFARVAVTYLIFSDTKSVWLSAAAFAISYLPWVAGGPVLAAISERYPYRRVMIVCDLTRMALVALLAIPAVPLWLLLGLLFLSSLLNPPAQSARSAMLPLILKGDRYVVGLSVQAMVAQAAQVSGYAAGGLFAALVSPRAALLVDSATFALSAVLIWRGVRPRPPAMTEEHRSHLLRETAEGFRVVFGDPVMRAIALLVFALVSVIIVPEGLAVAWSGELGGEAWRAGLMMASIPFGYVIGGLVVGRMLSPSTRLKLIRPLAVLVPLALIPAVLQPPFEVVLLLGLVAGFGNAVLMPLNGLFVQVLPNPYRARAFGIMQGGMQVLHAAAVMLTGAIAGRFPVPVVVGVWSFAGMALIVFAAARWPSGGIIDGEIEQAKLVNEPRPATRNETRQTSRTTREQHRAKAGALRGPRRQRGGDPFGTDADSSQPVRL
jgi:predicted MFS family arabinose efflux permease